MGFLDKYPLGGAAAIEVILYSFMPAVSVSVPLFLSARPSDRNQILHTYSDRYGTHSHLNKLAPCMGLGSLGTISAIGLWRREAERRPSPYSMELSPASEFAFFRLV